MARQTPWLIHLVVEGSSPRKIRYKVGDVEWWIRRTYEVELTCAWDLGSNSLNSCASRIILMKTRSPAFSIHTGVR